MSSDADGTMTESSNYDAFPPGPPAYGVWRRVGMRQYEAKYAVFLTNQSRSSTKSPKAGAGCQMGADTDAKITLAEDGNAFESTIRFDFFDPQGKPVEGGGEATGHGERIRF